MTARRDRRIRSNARGIRLDAGYSRELLAARAGTGLETVRRLDRGEVVTMKIETLFRLAAALGVAPAELLPDLGCRIEPAQAPPRQMRLRSASRLQPQPR